MKIAGWLPLLALLVLAAAGGALAIFEIPVLQVVNPDRPATLILRLGEPKRFSISYIHSIYLQAAAEEFEVGEGQEIILRGVKTQSPSVAHYYGFGDDKRDFYPVDRRIKSLVLRLGMSQAQTLSHGERKISLGDLGEKGDRLEIRVVGMTWGSYLLSRVVKEKG